MTHKLILIDDDVDLCRLLSDCSNEQGIEMLHAYTGSEGLNMFNDNKNNISLVVLDVMLPVLDGFTLLTQIRKASDVPIIMLTAKDDEDSRVKGLTCGADDYLSKPFSIREFFARVHSQIRRYDLNHKPLEEEKIINLRDLEMESDTRTVKVHGHKVQLTAKEFDLLFFLASNKGRVYTKEQLYREVWHDEYAFDDSNIMAFISKLRKKIEPDDKVPFYIQTIRGIGYRINPEA